MKCTSTKFRQSTERQLNTRTRSVSFSVSRSVNWKCMISPGLEIIQEHVLFLIQALSAWLLDIIPELAMRTVPGYGHGARRCMARIKFELTAPWIVALKLTLIAWEKGNISSTRSDEPLHNILPGWIGLSHCTEVHEVIVTQVPAVTILKLLILHKIWLLKWNHPRAIKDGTSSVHSTYFVWYRYLHDLIQTTVIVGSLYWAWIYAANVHREWLRNGPENQKQYFDHARLSSFIRT